MGIGTEPPRDSDARKAMFTMSGSLRWLFLVSIPLLLAACASAGPAAADAATNPPVLGVDLGGSGPVAAVAVATAPPAASHAAAAHARHSGGMQMAHAGHSGAHGTGTINAVDAAARRINVSHAPITELGWPAMTMDFPVAPGVDLSALKPGMKINFMIEKGQMGPVIQSVTPAGGGR